jgi:hypothetical protein
MRSPESILELYKDRKASLAGLHGKQAEIAAVYNGKITVPLLDMEREEAPSVPNLLAQGIDQMAARISSTTPAVSFSSQEPGKRKYDRRAQDASRTIAGWWQADRLMLKQKTRARRLIAYAMAPTVIRWDYKNHRPIWHVRHPLETYPSPDLQPGQVKPNDCIFSFTRSVGWLRANGYGEAVYSLTGDNEEVTHDSLVTIVEYMDAEQTTMMACGHYGNSRYYGEPADGSLKGIVLERFPTMGGEIPVIIPTRITLDKMTGQFDQMIGMYYQQAKLMALETIAVEKGIFPDTYLESRPGEQARFLDGPHDGRTGRINIVAGGVIREVQSQPGYLTNPTIDRYERAQRLTAGIPAEFGGESGSNIRTGRRGDAVLSAVIDFPVAEAQEVFAFALEEENKAAIAMAKRIDGDTPRTIYVGTGNSSRPVTYKPSETFENPEHVVSYPATGADVNALIIGLGQRVGLGIMSKETAATLDPFIDNPEAEHDRIISEGLEQALVAGIQQQASSGQIPPVVLSKVMTLVKTDKMELAEALTKVTEDALEEQRRKEQAEAGAVPATVDAATADATVGAMAGGGMSPIPGPNQGQQDLASLMAKLRQPAMTIQPMRGVARGAV